MDDLSGEFADSGVWYIESIESAKSKNKQLAKVFNQKKDELSKSGINDSILKNTNISICIHEISERNWTSYNDNEAKTWISV